MEKPLCFVFCLQRKVFTRPRGSQARWQLKLAGRSVKRRHYISGTEIGEEFEAHISFARRLHSRVNPSAHHMKLGGRLRILSCPCGRIPGLASPSCFEIFSTGAALAPKQLNRMLISRLSPHLRQEPGNNPGYSRFAAMPLAQPCPGGDSAAFSDVHWNVSCFPDATDHGLC